MIDVYKVKITKEQFESMPEEARTAVFVVGHILNQISVFHKLIRFSNARDPANPVEANASSMQTQILLRSLMASLAEASVWLDDRAGLIAQYLSDMPTEAQEWYKAACDHSDPKSLLMMIRNNFIYHFPNEKNVERAFKEVSASEPWEWYFSQANTNTMYFSSELVIGYGLMRFAKEPDPMIAFGVVIQKTGELANVMQDILMHLIGAIVTRHLGADALKPQEKTSIEDAPTLGEFWLPFFAIPKS
jgi:hypothetical protein